MSTIKQNAIYFKFLALFSFKERLVRLVYTNKVEVRGHYEHRAATWIQASAKTSSEKRKANVQVWAESSSNRGQLGLTSVILVSSFGWMHVGSPDKSSEVCFPWAWRLREDHSNREGIRADPVQSETLLPKSQLCGLWVGTGTKDDRDSKRQPDDDYFVATWLYWISIGKLWWVLDSWSMPVDYEHRFPRRTRSLGDDCIK